MLVNSFPDSLKNAIGVSIGLMIAALGLKNAGIIVFNNNFLVLGDLRHGAPLVAIIGIAVTAILLALRFKAGMLLGIIITIIIGLFVVDPASGQVVTNHAALSQNGAFTMPPSIGPIFLSFSFDTSRILTLDFLVIVFTFLFVDIFDSLGAFLGVLGRVGIDANRYSTRIPKALMCDAVGTMVGACLGVSTVTTYAESSAGVSVGGRTGLTALVVGVFFLISLFFSNLFLIVPSAATAAAMVIVGMYLAASAVNIDFNDYTIGVPAVLTIIVTTLTVSISDGLMFGWIGLLVIKLFAGRIRELNAVSIVVGIIFLIRAIFI